MQTSIKDQETRDGKSMTTGTRLTGLRNVRRRRWSHGKVSSVTEGFVVEDYNMVDKTSTISMSPHPVSFPVTSLSILLSTHLHPPPFVISRAQTRISARKTPDTVISNNDYTIFKNRNYVLLDLYSTHIT